MRIQLSLSLLLTASVALATDGYFDHGYGVKAKGLGGAGVAFAQDSIVSATNPAGSGRRRRQPSGRPHLVRSLSQRHRQR
jgi:hypothetical protein